MRTTLCNLWPLISAISAIVTIFGCFPFKRNVKQRDNENAHNRKDSKEDIAPRKFSRGLKAVLRGVIAIICIPSLILSVGAALTSSKVINVVELELGSAIQTLHEAGIEVEFYPEESVPDDIVCKQSVPADEYIQHGAVVILYTDHSTQQINTSETSGEDDNNIKSDDIEPSCSVSEEPCGSTEPQITPAPSHTQNEDYVQQPTPSQNIPPQSSPPANTANPIAPIESPPPTASVPPSDLSSAEVVVPWLGWEDWDSPFAPVPPSGNDPPTADFDISDVLPLPQPPTPGTYLYLNSNTFIAPLFTSTENYVIEDYDALPFETLIVHLYVDDDSAIGAEIGFHFETGGGGFGLNEAFYNGMTFEISAGTYAVELRGAEITNSLYLIDEDGNIQYPRHTNTAIINFTRSGNYTIHIDW